MRGDNALGITRQDLGSHTTCTARATRIVTTGGWSTIGIICRDKLRTVTKSKPPGFGASQIVQELQLLLYKLMFFKLFSDLCLNLDDCLYGLALIRTLVEY